jgi:hypothetical protein
MFIPGLVTNIIGAGLVAILFVERLVRLKLSGKALKEKEEILH